jgi:uncharacterized membrane protein
MSITAFKARLRLALVTPGSPGHTLPPISLAELREVPGGIPRNIWSVLCSLPAKRALAWAIVLVFVAVDIALVGQHALVRYQSYHAGAFDLGNMDQAVWNTLHGHPFRFTNRGFDWFGPSTRLGVHVEPILLLIAPLYLLHSGPETLLVLQTVALALGGIPLFLLGLRRLPEIPLVAVAFVGAYLVTPEILGVALYDFHPVALATPLLLLALWALDARHYGWFVAAAALAALCKEEVGLSLLPLGLFIACRQGHPRLGAVVSLLSAAWVAFCFLVILPHYNAHTAGANNFWYRYAWLGNSPGTALLDVLTHPQLLLAPLVDPARRDYLAELLRTAGGLGLFAPALLVSAVPELAINLLSSHAPQYSGLFQYNAVLLPYLMTAAISGTATLYRASKRVEARVSTAVLPQGSAHLATHGTGAREILRSFSRGRDRLLRHVPLRSSWTGPLVIVWLIAFSCWNITATSTHIGSFWEVGSHPNPQQAQINGLLARVPRTASVAATDTLDPHLSDRYALYLLPDPQSYMADYVAIDLSDAAPVNQQEDQQMYAAMLFSGSYRLVGTAGQVVLLEHLSLQSPALQTQGLATGQIRKDGLMDGKPTVRRLKSLKHGHAQSSKSRGGETRQLRVMGVHNASRGRLL